MDTEQGFYYLNFSNGVLFKNPKDKKPLKKLLQLLTWLYSWPLARPTWNNITICASHWQSYYSHLRSCWDTRLLTTSLQKHLRHSYNLHTFFSVQDTELLQWPQELLGYIAVAHVFTGTSQTFLFSTNSLFCAGHRVITATSRAAGTPSCCPPLYRNISDILIIL